MPKGRSRIPLHKPFKVVTTYKSKRKAERDAKMWREKGYDSDVSQDRGSTVWNVNRTTQKR